MPRRADQPLPSFATLDPAEESFFATRQGENGEPVMAGEPATPEPTPDLPPEPAPETELPETPLAAEPAEPVDDGDLPSEEDLDLPLVEDPAVVAQGVPAQRQVPLATVQAERARRKEVERALAAKDSELRAAMEWKTRIDERLRVLNEQNAAARRPVVPDPNEDPEGYRAHIDQQREARIEQLEQRLAATEQGGQQGQIMNQVSAMTQNFAATTPDYHATVQALRATLDKEYEAAYYDDPNERAYMVNAWTDAVVRKALQRGVNPAEAVYKIAKMRGLGGPAAAASDPSRAVAPPGNAARLASVRKGQAATRSLSGGGGRDVADGLTIDKLLHASPTEFARLCAEQPAVVATLMGK